MKTSTQTLYLANTYGPEKAIKIMCETGFDCIDYSMFGGKKGKMDIEKDSFLYEMNNLRNVAESYGVAFNQAHAPFASFREGDVEYNQWVKPLIIKSIEASGILGVKYIIVHPFTVSKNQKQANLDFFNSLIPYAKKHNVKIAIENMFGWDAESKTHCKNVCSDGAELCDYIDSLNSEHIVACLDIGHCGLVGEDAAQMILQLGHDRLKCLHIQDNDKQTDQHSMPFTGKLDFKGIMKALKDIDYDGELTLEADNFLRKFPDELLKDAALLMYNSVKYLNLLYQKL